MDEISNELLNQARELLKNKPEESKMDDMNYLKFKLHIGMVKAYSIIEAIKKVSNE